MPSLTFPDFEAYSNAVKGVDGEMRVTGRSDAAWVLNTLEIGDVSVLHGMDGAPVTYRGALHASRFGVYLSLPGSDTELEGEQVGDDGYIWMAPRQEMQGFTRVPARFLGVDLAEARVLGQAVRMGLDTQALYRTTHVRANPQLVAEVVAMTQRAFEVHAENPDAFVETGAQQAFAAQITQPWTDLTTLLGGEVSRNAVVTGLLAHLLPALELFEQDGLAPFLARYAALDSLAGRAVRVEDGGTWHEGQALGLAEDGALRVRIEGVERVFHAGEVSVRAQ